MEIKLWLWRNISRQFSSDEERKADRRAREREREGGKRTASRGENGGKMRERTFALRNAGEQLLSRHNAA